MLLILSVIATANASTFIGNPRRPTKGSVAPTSAQSHAGTLSIASADAIGCDGSLTTETDIDVDIHDGDAFIALDAAPCTLSLAEVAVLLDGTDDQGGSFSLTLDVGDLDFAFVSSVPEEASLIVSLGSPEWSSVLMPWLTPGAVLTVDSAHPLHGVLVDTLRMGSAVYVDTDADGALSASERSAPVALP